MARLPRTAPQHTSSYVLSGFAAIFSTVDLYNPEAGRVPVYVLMNPYIYHHVVKGSKVNELFTEHAQ